MGYQGLLRVESPAGERPCGARGRVVAAALCVVGRRCSDTCCYYCPPLLVPLLLLLLDAMAADEPPAPAAAAELHALPNAAAPRSSSRSVRIDFHDIQFTVTLNKPAGEKLQILKGVSGACLPSRVLACMGSSGAGKTTLLDVLACQAFGGGVGGEVLVNGAPLKRAAFQLVACYVPQRDVLLSSATVRETLMTAALLKLPRKMPYADKVARVDTIITELVGGRVKRAGEVDG